MLYLDNSATTQMLPEVKDAMIPFLLEEYGNPSSKYYPQATHAKEEVDRARKHVANLLGCDAQEIVFTSGATESNNMLIKGIVDHHDPRTKHVHIVTSKVEHPSVLETFKYLQSKGFVVTYLDVDQFGRIQLEDLQELFRNDPPVLCSIMWGNNELGSLQPIKKISELCIQYQCHLHTDATQVIGKMETDLSQFPGITLLSCSAHKFNGPKGIGVAVIKKDKNGLPTLITPLLHGGGQEFDYRSGTLAVHNIVGLGKAAELAHERLKNNIKQLLVLEDKLNSLLREKFSSVLQFNHDQVDKIPGILSIQFKGINNEILLKNIASEIAASTGSACSSTKPSHVLAASGYNNEEVRSTIRFSLSPYTSLTELEIFKQL
ncbi:cysteine desulfurase family protein [Shouchella shacheensis]|uniref:cysteine desulfurase family protein n=1 Tax=Shouchella shacheensis TaxID=1649580 RepID=UPI0007400E57|nr:cysteine desulfurase family protein [Shouchella shacheensis]